VEADPLHQLRTLQKVREVPVGERGHDLHGYPLSGWKRRLTAAYSVFRWVQNLIVS
jgi:hypothetical protein